MMYYLKNLSCVAITGNNVKDFLQGQLTADMRLITPKTGAISCYCNIKGRIQAIVFVIQDMDDENKFYVTVDSSIRDMFIEELNKYAMFSKILVKHETGVECFGAVISDKQHVDIPSGFPNLQYGVSQSEDCITYRISSYNNSTLYVTITNKASSIYDYLYELSVNSSIEEWNLMNIYCGIPWITADTYELFLPHNIGMKELGAISLAKGCYRGQEIIARMEYLGDVKRQLAMCESFTNQTIRVGQMLFAHDDKEKIIGTVINIAVEATNMCVFLAEVQKTHSESGLCNLKLADKLVPINSMRVIGY